MAANEVNHIKNKLKQKHKQPKVLVIINRN